MLPIVLLSFCSVALAAERSPGAQGRQVVLTQLIFPPNGQQLAGPGKFVETAVPLPARQVSYNFPQMKPNYVDGFQYYPVFPGQEPGPYGAGPFVYYPPGAPYVPASTVGKDGEQGGSGGWASYFPSLSTLQGYFPTSFLPQGAQGGEEAVESANEENGGGSANENKKPLKLQQQYQQQLAQQQQAAMQQQYQQAQELQQNQLQLKSQQPHPSQAFYAQQPGAAPGLVGNTREGAPAGVQGAASGQFPQFLLRGQPQYFGPYPEANRVVGQDPSKLAGASHGAVSNYLFLKNQQQLPLYQTQQRYDSPSTGENSVAAAVAAGVGRPAAGPAKRLELEKYSLDAKNQRSPLYAQHVSALQVTADPANIQGHLIAQASPEAIAAAGKGGKAGADPTGQAIVGNNGLALSAPKSTAIAGHPDIEVVINLDKKSAKKPVAKYSKNKGYHVDYSS